MPDDQNIVSDDLDMDLKSALPFGSAEPRDDEFQLFPGQTCKPPAPDAAQEDRGEKRDFASGGIHAGDDSKKPEQKESSVIARPPEAGKEESVTLSKTKFLLIKKLISNVKENADELNRLILPLFSGEDEARISIGQLADENLSSGRKTAEAGGEKIIEGVFDGERMIGPDGKSYSVPANYASKSKLVEGDMMKLTIALGGAFLYKQIGPVERGRVIGRLERDDSGIHYVRLDEKRWRILSASVTYFRGEPGDETIILVPKYGESAWAAVENIVRKN
ncbi:MAG: hypothetical protein WC745_04065 [Patescibacteria group bacterium]|jgi:hypothetical protein